MHFLQFLVKSQPHRSYKKGSYKKTESTSAEKVMPADIAIADVTKRNTRVPDVVLQFKTKSF